jgi:hypothetical protein
VHSGSRGPLVLNCVTLKMKVQWSFNIGNVSIYLSNRILRSYVNASQIYVHNYPTRCDSMQFIYCCKLLYMFRAATLPIIRSTYNCIHGMVLVVVSELLPPAIVIFIWPRQREVAAQTLRQWRTEGGVGGSNPPPKFRSFDKAEPNSQFRGKYIRNRLVFLFHHPN